MTTPEYTLNDGTLLPAVGFGTYPLRGSDGQASIESAIAAGYRLIDSAVNYRNEVEVGRAIAASGVARDEFIVTTKVPGRDHGRAETRASLLGSLSALGLDYLDLYLIHWPNPSVDKYVETWATMVELRSEGLVRSIGVSNFTEQFLERLSDETGVVPSVNQIELHPFFPQAALREYHEAHGIRTEAWSPLARVKTLFEADPIRVAAGAHGVTPAQVVLRWHVQLGSVAVPKAAAPERQRSNLDIFGFELSDREMSEITALGRPDGRIFGADPDTHEEQ